MNLDTHALLKLPPHLTGTNALAHLALGKMAPFFKLADDNFKCIFLNEQDKIAIRISLKLFPRGPIDNKPTLFLGNGLVPNRRHYLMLARFTDAYI